MADAFGLRAAPGLAALKAFLGVALSVSGAWLSLAVSPGFAGVAAAGLIVLVEAAMDARWSLEVGEAGLRLGASGARQVRWDDVRMARVEPSWWRRAPVLTVGTKPGSRSPELRFFLSRLAAADRRRLLAALESHGIRVGAGDA